MKKRSRWLFIVAAIVLVSITQSLPNVYAEERSVHILNEEEQVEQITIEQEEKQKLKALASGLEVQSYQWQILMSPENDLWVDIADKTEQECEVSYAMVKSLLDDSNSAYLRCAIDVGDDEPVYSEPACITVSMGINNANYDFMSMEVAESALNYKNAKAIALANDEYATITINYLDYYSHEVEQIEKAIYSPYTASVEKGTDFSQTVLSPTFLGFAPFYAKDSDGVIDDDASKLELNYTAVNADIIINIYYKPIDVNFAIRYFFQNINDDLYTENVDLYHQGKAETGTIISNDYLLKHAGDTTGFQKLYHYPENVAADGSTVFECYYDRNYYLIQFDMAGGYGVDPIYARYDSPFIVNDPIRAGYKFTGWKLISADINNDGKWDDTLPGDLNTDMVNKIPAFNCYYQAQWTAEENDSSVHVVYWLENANPESDGSYQYSYWQSVTIENMTAGKTIEAKNYADIGNYDWGKNCLHFEYNKEKTEAQDPEIVKGDGTTVVNVYYDRKEYTLRFIFARSMGNDYEHALNTEDDEYYKQNWKKIEEFDSGNWSNLTNSTSPKMESFENEGYTYYYFEIKANYGARIDNEWVRINNLLAENKLEGTENPNVFISWRTHQKSGYGSSNTNKNLKGAYPYMDDMVIVKDGDDNVRDTHVMTSYNHNGVSYYQYEIYFNNNSEPESKFIVNPTASYGQQSTFQYEGMEYVVTKYYDRNENGELVEETNLDSIPNPEYNDIDNPAVIRFYYESKEFALEFYNYNSSIDTMKQTVAYGTSLKSYQPTEQPQYPEVLEKDAYVFAGWYTVPECFEGTEVRWDTDTMPAQDSKLYAKWIPVEHTVNFFVTYDEMLAYEENSQSTVYKQVTGIEHGLVISEEIVTPTYIDEESGMNLVFAGWFYLEFGEKKAFTPLDMPINQDLNVFADWSSNSPQPYKIQYLLESDKTIKVAEDTVGYAYGGSTRTFIPKAGNPFNQLYENYSDGFFPTIGSHSITMEYEPDDQNPVHNVYEFYYVHAENIAYTVRYVNKETNTVMKEVSRATTSSVVTERFEPFTNMVPDAFYKRLVLAVEYDEATDSWIGSKDNVITFYYTPNEKSAYYAVHFMLEKLDATDETRKNYATNGTGGYEEAGTHLEGVGDIGEYIPITPQAFEGFELISDKAVTKINGQEEPCGYGGENYKIEVTPNGTELYLFYKRLSYNYSVHYYLYNTSTSVDSENFPSEVKIARYGATVEAKAKTIPGYTCVSAETQTMTIRADKEQNAIIFYYSPIEYRIEYIVITEPVSETDGGTLSNTLEVIDGDDPVVGSIPKANKYYEFAGWYLDEECTQDVDEFGDVDKDTGEFKPNKAKLDAKNGNQFYAKFVRLSGDFTITRANAETDQVYVYEIENDESGEKIYVTITGNDSVTIHELPFGNYTITQQNSWSWRYVDEAISEYEHKDANGSTVEFEKLKDSSKSKWLNGNSKLIRNERGE